MRFEEYEGGDDAMGGPPLYGDESYQGPPAQGFEDSRDAGVALFRSSTDLNSGGPSDFGFLLQASSPDTKHRLGREAVSPSPSDPSSESTSDNLATGCSPGSTIAGPRLAKRGRVDVATNDAGNAGPPSSARVPLRPPCPRLQPHDVPFGVVDGEERGPDAMDPPVIRTDPFFWMRDDSHQQDGEAMRLLRDEDSYCDHVLGPLRALRDQLYAEMRSHMQEVELDVPVPHPDGYAYYSRSFQGCAYRAHYCARVVAGAGCGGAAGAAVPGDVATLSAVAGLELRDEELLLDENGLARDSAGEKLYLSVHGPYLSPDHRFIAYAEDFDGNDSYRISIRPHAPAAGEEVPTPDQLERTDGSLQWASSGHAAAYYVELDTEYRGCTVRRHVLGTSQTRDTVLFHERDKRFPVSAHGTADGRFLLVAASSSETSEVHLLDLHDPAPALVCVCARQFGHRYAADHRSGSLYLLTNSGGAKSGKVCCLPLAALPAAQGAWRDVWAPGPGVQLEAHACFEEFMVVEGREAGVTRIFVLHYPSPGTPAGAPVHAVVFPEESVHSGSLLTPRTRTAATALYTVSCGENHLFAAQTLRLNYTSYVVPDRTYAYHVPTRTFKIIRDKQVPGFDPGLYRAERIASARRQVPISVVYRADLHPRGLRGGPFPTVLTGYGAYGACQDPEFDASLLGLLDRGAVYAVAHVRGGGELGRQWYEEGRYRQVKNRFHDFLAVAEALVELGISEPSRLAAWGESSGGLLVAASVNMRPELFKAMLLEVPFVDALTTMSDPSIPLTCAEWEEIGNSNERDTFYYMMEYSPYDNIRVQNYPAALITSSLNDAMVGYWEPLKYANKLRLMKTGSQEVLLKVNFHAGHGHSSDRYEYLQERSHNFAFLCDQLGL